MKLNIRTSCENAPKKELIKDLTVLFAAYDISQAMQYLEDDVIWTLVGDEPIVGKEPFAAALMEMAHNKATELTIHSIVTHGKEAAINGEMVMGDGNVFGFADFYEFTSVKGSKVRSITSYVVQKVKSE
ncbi:nuclear transport factor 2 family protein [Marinoscillum luteum]|uniref:Nuclear transport factor 2 family protein n=1 Tax=Marinoscillum luteum TaxID=861051 RepID=A0ABW7N5G9_9BACT